ncbi:MAG: hypothetical protein IPI06_13985 [Gammaproteobacteria bacterium]|nr:hypothetical protein [Gammaproteobacteria bacterium]
MSQRFPAAPFRPVTHRDDANDPVMVYAYPARDSAGVSWVERRFAVSWTPGHVERRILCAAASAFYRHPELFEHVAVWSARAGWLDLLTVTPRGRVYDALDRAPTDAAFAAVRNYLAAHSPTAERVAALVNGPAIQDTWRVEVTLDGSAYWRGVIAEYGLDSPHGRWVIHPRKGVRA